MTFYGCRCWPSTVCAVGVSSRCLLVRRSGWVPGLHSEPSQNRPWKGQSHANFKARTQWKKQCRKAQTIWYATLHGLVVRSQLQHFLVDFRWCFEIEETRHKCRRGSRKAEFASNSTKIKQKHPLVTQQLPWKITIIEFRYPYSNYQSVVSPSVSNVQSRQFRMLFGVRVQLCQGHCGCPASHFPRFEGETLISAVSTRSFFHKQWPHLGFLR